MTVSADQIKKAQAHGIINVAALAAACDAHQFPFYLALTIVERESPDRPRANGGANIFGHDHGGAFTDPNGHNIEVTEERYKQFLKLIGAGHTSNGVGPMQLTYRGYHIGPRSLQALDLKGWLAADTMLYGVGLLSKSMSHYYGLGMSLEKAWWHTGRDYNNSDTYADAVVERAKFWLAVVGNPDTKPQGDDMPLSDVDLAKLRAAWQADLAKVKTEVVNELFTEPNKKRLAGAVWQTDGLIASGDPKDAWYKPETFLKLIWGALKKKP